MAVGQNWNGPATQEYLLVASLDTNGALRVVDPNTFANVGPGRFGWQTIYALDAYDADGDGVSELVIGSAESGGTIRLLAMDNLFGDIAWRSGFGIIDDLAYGPLGLAQVSGGASILVATSNGGGGTVHNLRVDGATLPDAAVRNNLGQVAQMELIDFYATNVDYLAGMSNTTTGEPPVGWLLDEQLNDLEFFAMPEPTSLLVMILAIGLLRRRRIA